LPLLLDIGGGLGGGPPPILSFFYFLEAATKKNASFGILEFLMNPQRIFGVLLLVCGVVLLITGFNAAHSISDQVSRTFTGRFTETTTWYIVGGIVSGLLGLSMILFGVRGKSA
jgi:hypothetical protein